MTLRPFAETSDRQPSGPFRNERKQLPPPHVPACEQKSEVFSSAANHKTQKRFKNIAKTGAKVVVTTDHGTVKVNEAIKIVGPKDTNTNLRYKTGKNLDYNEKEVFRIKNPDDAYLPKENLSGEYVFCKTDGFFVYPNNFNHFLKHYKDTFQHGGISMEEMLIPYVEMTPKSK